MHTNYMTQRTFNEPKGQHNDLREYGFSRERYYIYPLRIQGSVIEDMKMDLSWGTDTDNIHNHNINNSEEMASGIDTEKECALEHNYCYLATQRKGKPCVDFEEHLLQ